MVGRASIGRIMQQELLSYYQYLNQAYDKRSFSVQMENLGLIAGPETFWHQDGLICAGPLQRGDIILSTK